MISATHTTCCIIFHENSFHKNIKYIVLNLGPSGSFSESSVWVMIKHADSCWFVDSTVNSIIRSLPSKLQTYRYFKAINLVEKDKNVEKGKHMLSLRWWDVFSQWHNYYLKKIKMWNILVKIIYYESMNVVIATCNMGQLHHMHGWLVRN